MLKKLIATVQIILLFFPLYGQFLISGNSGYSTGNLMAPCSDGSVYVTGDYICNLAVEELRIGPDSCIQTNPNPRNFYVLKLDAQGNRQWLVSSDITETQSQYIINGIFADDADYLWVAGSFSDSMCIENQRIKSSSPNDCFVARFSPSGTIDTLVGNFALNQNTTIDIHGFKYDQNGHALLYGAFDGSMKSSSDTVQHPTKQLFLSRINQIYESEFLITRLDSPLVSADSSAIKALTGNYNQLKMAIEANRATEYEFDTTFTIDSTLNTIDTTWSGSTIVSIDTTYIYDTLADVDTTIIIIPENTFLAELQQDTIFSYKHRANYTNITLAAENNNGHLFLLDNINTPVNNVRADKYDASYNLLWTHETSNASSNIKLRGLCMDTDDDGHLYYGGSYQSLNGSSNFSIGGNTLTANPDKNGYLVKIDENGATTWVQSLGSTPDNGDNNFAAHHDVLSDILVKASTELLGAGYYSNNITLGSLTLQNPNGSNNLFIGHVDPFPGFVVDINQPDSVDVCQGSTILLEVTQNDNYTYRWKKNGVVISGATGNAYNASDSALYRAEVTNTNNGYVKHSSAVFVHVREYPEAIISTNDDTIFCAGQNAKLSTINNSSHQYQWLQNNAELPNDILNTITTENSGTYQLIISNPYGCVDTSNSITLQVLEPVAEITNNSDLSLCDGDSIALEAVYQEGSHYQWFRDNNLLEGDTLQILQAKTTGTYTVEVTVLDNCTQVSDAVNVSVIPSPPAELTFGGDSVLCKGQQTTLAANTGFNLTYLWMLNNDTLLGETSPILTIDTSGTYRVIVGYEGSCSRWSAPKVVEVNPLPQVNLTIDGDTNFCKGEHATISTLANNNYSYVWIKNTDTLYQQTNHEMTVTQTGNYYAKVTNAQNCVNYTPRQGFVVKSSPKATLFYSPDTLFCENNSIELYTYDLPNQTYQWYNNNSLVSGATQYLLTIDHSGHFYVEVTNTDNNCTSISETMETKMIPSPAESIETASEPLVCKGDSLLLSVPAYEGWKYQWQQNGYTMYQDTLPGLYATEGGDYTIEMVNEYNCSATSQPLSITLLENPVPSVSVNGLFLSTNDRGTLQWNRDGEPLAEATNHLFLAEQSGIYTVTAHYNNGCSATSVLISVCKPVPTLTVNESFITASEGEAYQWYFDDERIDGANLQTHRAQVSGYYKAEVTCSGGYSSFTEPLLVCIPVPTITQTDVNVLEASVGNSYQWYFNNSPMPGADARVLQVEKTGNYKVWVENLEGCASFTKPLQVLFQGVSNKKTGQVTLHPNPAQTTVTLKNLPWNKSNSTQVSIYSLFGQQLLTLKLNHSNNAPINIERLQAGTYLVYIQQPSFMHVIKLVKL